MQRKDRFALTCLLFLSIAFCCIAASIAGCKNKDCQAFKPFIDAGANVIASFGTCSEITAMQNDLFKYCADHNLCKAPPAATLDAVKAKGPIADIVCPIAVMFVQDFATSTAWAQKYHCTGQSAANFTLAACLALPWKEAAANIKEPPPK